MEGGDEAPAEGEAAVDPGAEGAAAKEMEAAVSPHKYEGVETPKGWANVGGALLTQAVTQPLFGDILRAHALTASFNPDKFKPNGYTGAAALVSALAAKNETEEKEYWLSGYVTEEYLASLNDIVTDKSSIHFPFLVAGWATEQEAKDSLQFYKPEKVDNYQRVLFKVSKAKAFTFASVRVVSHRLHGNVTAAEKQDDINVFNIESADLAAQTVKAWEEARKAVAATPAAADAAPADAEKPAAADGEPAAADEPAAAE